MTERDLEKKCIAYLAIHLPGCFLWKICDSNTGGIPDLEVSWHGATTKIEFKLLGPEEDLHKKWEDGRQLVTCVQMEKSTQRCWVVVFVRAGKRPLTLPETRIYRPTALLHGTVPKGQHLENFLTIGRCLWSQGAIRCEGFNYEAVLELIKQTHL